jgi:ring-1,2-phenylacetyl-CoA epoxidase subunit PaaD
MVSQAATLDAARSIAGSVPDPELPMLTLGDLGILRAVTLEDGRVTVSLTPTYSGCPAMHVMRGEVTARLAAAGFGEADVRTVLTPAWSSDFITAEGRRKLTEAGIAPPRSLAPGGQREPVPLTLFARRPAVPCPACGSADTQQTAAFGGTACKDLHRCRSCGEPFEHVKEI